MKLWASLYALIWLVFLEFWLALTPIAPPVPYYLHAVLGFAIIALAYSNFQRLRQSTVPGRLKRIAQATLSLCVFMALLGVLLFFQVGAAWTILPGVTVAGFILFLHFLNAAAIITQAAAVALAYDMWEDKEYLQETRPGEVPAAPRPETPAGHG